MNKKFTTVLTLAFSTLVFSQNLNFGDVKMKKLLLSSNNTNNIAFDISGASIAIDTNNDGEIQQSEADKIIKLNIKQDDKFKYLDADKTKLNEVYYQAHLPDNVKDILLFKNLEEAYVFDSKLINIHFKDNDKLRIFHGIVRNENTEKTVIFENSSGLTDVNNVVFQYLDDYNNTIILQDQSKLSIINCPNIKGEVILRNNIKELEFKNVNITNFVIDEIKLLDNLKISGLPSLTSILWNDKRYTSIGNERKNPLTIDASNNINLTSIVVDDYPGDNYSLMIDKLNVKGNSNLKKIRGLNSETIDFSNDGLRNLEELDIAYRNKYIYSSQVEVSFGDVKNINLKGLPNLKRFIGFNQKLESIDFSSNPLLEEIDLINTVDFMPQLTISNLNNLNKVYLSQSYAPADSSNLTDFFLYKLKDLKINNNPSLVDLQLDYILGLESLELKNNAKLENFEYGDYAIEGTMLADNPEKFALKSFQISDNIGLKSLKILGTNLLSLDVSKNINLEKIELLTTLKLANLKFNNNIKDVRLYNQVDLKSLDFNNIKLENLYIKKFTELTNISFQNNNLLKNIKINEAFGSKKINFGTMPNVEDVELGNSDFSEITFKNNKKLINFKIGEFGVKQLDFTEAPNIKMMLVGAPKLEQLNVTKNIEVELFLLPISNIPSLDLSHMNKLDMLRTNVPNLNIRNNSIESELYLAEDATLNVCVDDQQLLSVKSEYPEANITTDCNIKSDYPTVKSLSVYPNPVKDNVEIKSPNLIKRIEITNLLGKQVASATPNSYSYKTNLSHIKSGIYFIKISTDKLFYIRTIIKK